MPTYLYIMILFCLSLDSGGPLTCDNMLVGLSSFGVQCGFSFELPGVFADVFYYRQWIEDNSGARRNFGSSVLLLTLTFLLKALKIFC